MSLVGVLVLAVSGCTGSSSAAGPALDDLDWEIAWDGVGPVEVGVTFDEIAAALGPGFEIGEEVELDDGLIGHSVSLDDEVLLWFGTRVFEGTPAPEDPTFEVLLVESERLSLPSGLRVGMPIAEAVELHGEPTFWPDTTDLPHESVAFADGTGDFAETILIDYDPAGTIGTISVVCFGPGRQSCPPA